MKILNVIPIIHSFPKIAKRMIQHWRKFTKNKSPILNIKLRQEEISCHVISVRRFSGGWGLVIPDVTLFACSSSVVTTCLNSLHIRIVWNGARNFKGGEIRDTKTLNLSRNIVSSQVLVDVSRFSPCVINLSRNKNICSGLKKVVAKSRARVFFVQQILALLLFFRQTHSLARNRFARTLANQPIRALHVFDLQVKSAKHRHAKSSITVNLQSPSCWNTHLRHHAVLNQWQNESVLAACSLHFNFSTTLNIG